MILDKAFAVAEWSPPLVHSPLMFAALTEGDPALRGKLMVNNAKLGAALAKTLGNDSVALIRAALIA